MLLGVGLGYFPRLARPLIATIMAFGSGVLMAALSFDLLEEAYDSGGTVSTSMEFFGGALLYTIPNYYLAQWGAQAPKNAGDEPGFHIPRSFWAADLPAAQPCWALANGPKNPCLRKYCRRSRFVRHCTDYWIVPEDSVNKSNCIPSPARTNG